MGRSSDYEGGEARSEKRSGSSIPSVAAKSRTLKSRDDGQCGLLTADQPISRVYSRLETMPRVLGVPNVCLIRDARAPTEPHFVILSDARIP